jgi:hypothetical protein
MNKILVGLLLGAGLGAVDGMTAWFTPAVRAGIIGIVIGSTFKGMIAGIAAGWFARKVHSVAWGIAFGLLVGALLAYGVAAMQHGYYFEIMLPGSIVGAIVGWATQRYGRPARGGTAAATIAAIFLVSITVNARAAEPVNAAGAFAHLKALAGTWSGHAMTPDGPPASVSYRLTGGGTAVMETLAARDADRLHAERQRHHGHALLQRRQPAGHEARQGAVDARSPGLLIR